MHQKEEKHVKGQFKTEEREIRGGGETKKEKQMGKRKEGNIEKLERKEIKSRICKNNKK